MSKRRKTYTKSEKLEIVKLSLEDNESIKSLATRFEISEQSIYNWRRLFLEHEDAAFPGRGNKTLNESDRKIEELEKALREKQLEVDILKKAVGIFSRNDKKFSNL